MNTKRAYKFAKRDEELISDYNDFMPMYELVAKYKITETRIYQILDTNQTERRTKKTE